MECMQTEYGEETRCIEAHVIEDAAALRQLRLRAHNRADLEAIRRIIDAEEDRLLSADEVLARVLDFYGRFVPFRAPV